MRRLPRLPGWGSALVFGAALSGPPGVVAQEGAAADSAETPVRADTLLGELPGELVGELAAEPLDTTFAVLAGPLRAPADLSPNSVVWDRDRIRRSNAMTLGELLAEMTPGTVAVRAGFFSGPAHLVDGPFGPGAIDLRIDGRPVIPLNGSQPDLSRVLLAMIDEVRVERRAAGLRVDVTSLRRMSRPAYSRIEAGSGDPDLETLRLVFTNGFGNSFVATAGFELLNSDQPVADLSGFSGGIAWLPGGGTSGVELQFEQRSFERTVAVAEAGTRSRLVLGSRLGLTDHLQAAAWAGRSVRELDLDSGSALEGRDAVGHGGVEVRGLWDVGWAAAGGHFADDPSLPSIALEIEAGVAPLGWLTLEAGGRLGSWEEFHTREGRVGASVRLPLGFVDARLLGQAEAGRRGVPFVGTDSVAADSVDFEGFAGGVEVARGPFRVGGRIESQWVDRQPAFGTGFDEPGALGPGVRVTAFEASADVPVLPLSWLLPGFEAVRLRGFVRHNEFAEGLAPLFVPANAVRGELYFEDSFLEGDLGIRLAIGLDRRDAWFAPPAPGGEAGPPVTVPERTSFDFDLGLRIVGALIYWRYDNIAGRLDEDLPGFVFPPRRQVFGVRWEFLD